MGHNISPVLPHPINLLTTSKMFRSDESQSLSVPTVAGFQICSCSARRLQENNKAPKLELTHHTIKQPIDKPGSVVDDHLSSLQIALQIERLAIATSGSLIRGYLLAADRVYLRGMSPCSAVSSYLTPFTLTPLLERYCARVLVLRSGIVSVALSLGLPPVAVSDCRILCCPDFPLAK